MPGSQDRTASGRRICGEGHGSTDRLDGIFDELQRTLLRLPTPPDGRPGAVIVPVMAYRIEQLEQDDRSMIWFEFTPQAREVLQQSDYYAALLEALKRERSGQHAIRINDQYRVCCRWVDGDAYDVEITDYH
jgi:hypothetical protein